MAKKISVSKFAGVYYTESTVKKWRSRPDRCYWIAFKDAAGKLRWERCGWASEGWTPEAAQRKRYELLNKDRVGDYKPKVERKAELLTLGDFVEKHYLPWADSNKKHAKDDHCLYNTWIKKHLADKPMTQIGPLDLERIKKEMREAGRAAATIAHAIKLVRMIFNKAILWAKFTGTNPCNAVNLPKADNGRTRFLSVQEAQALLSALYEVSAQVGHMATLSLYGGLRRLEIFNLTWGDVDRANGVLYLRDTKNKSSRPVFISDPVAQVIDALTQGSPNEPIFKDRSGKQVAQLSQTFRRVVDRLGLNEGIQDPRQKVCFHSLRHTFASHAAMAGTPLYLIGKSLGHRTSKMTERYSHLAPDSHRQIFDTVAAAMQEEADDVVRLEK